MKTLRELFTGLILALASGALVLGAFSLALAQGTLPAAQMIGITPTSLLTLPAGSLNPTNPSASPTAASFLSFEATSTPCPIPDGWQEYTVKIGEDVASLAKTFGVSVRRLMKANCLDSQKLIPGSVIWIPSVSPTSFPTRREATQTLTSIPCGPPPGWVQYIVQPGDTLASLSQALGVSVQQLQLANCLGSSTTIYAGSPLFVPFLPPARLPTLTFTPLPSPTHTGTPVVTTAPPTTTPVLTLTPVPTETPTETLLPIPSDTPIPTSTPIQVPSATSEISAP